MLNKIKGAKIAPFFIHGLLVQEVSPIAMALDVPYIKGISSILGGQMVKEGINVRSPSP